MINNTKIWSHFRCISILIIYAWLVTLEWRPDSICIQHLQPISSFRKSSSIRHAGLGLLNSPADYSDSSKEIWSVRRVPVALMRLGTESKSPYSATLHLISVNWSKPLLNLFTSLVCKTSSWPIPPVQCSTFLFIYKSGLLSECP